MAFSNLRSEIRAVFERDPAAKNLLEVLLCYPGLHALFAHRMAHWFYRRHLYLLARIISQISRFFTGIEIHPVRKSGKGLY